MPVLNIIQQQQRVKRKLRTPTHKFALQTLPFQLQPFAIAPVVAGETLKAANWQMRTVSDPLAVGMSALIPWWVETYLFYVKLRDLDIKSQVEQLMLKNTALGISDAASTYTFHAKGVDWLKRCHEKIVNEYFRNEGEGLGAANAGLIDGVPAAKIEPFRSSWRDSLVVDTVSTPTNNDLQNPRDPAVMSEYLEQYERMRAMRLIDMSFEEWLGSYGVKVADPVEDGKPELLRVTRDWAYPTNTVDPSTGVPSTAFVHSLQERADKDRFFTEPGFLIGIHVIRPKVYMTNQRQTASVMLDNALHWLPALMRDEPHTSLKELLGGTTTATGPLYGQTDGYWVDVRDLFLYGDEFRNYAAAAGASFLARPSANGTIGYATLTEARAFFASTTAPVIRSDGVINFSVLSHPTQATDNS